MKMTNILSILIPVYNERECIEPLYERLNKESEKIPCHVEFMFVNDGSVDDTLSNCASNTYLYRLKK